MQSILECWGASNCSGGGSGFLSLDLSDLRVVPSSRDSILIGAEKEAPLGVSYATLWESLARRSQPRVHSSCPLSDLTSQFPRLNVALFEIYREFL